MSEGVVLEPSRLIAGALIGLVILLLLIIKFKVQAMVAILVGAISIGIVAGMPLADIITAVNGTPVTATEDVNDIKNQYSVGDELIFSIWRNGETMEITVVLVDTNDIYS